MVTVSKQKIIAQANCSASWRQNQLLLLVFGLWGLVISLLFCRQGAWLLLPIICVEMAVLFLALTITFKKLQQRQVLHFRAPTLTLEKINRAPTRHWQMVQARTKISVERQPHPWDPLKINLCTGREQIPVGEFLNHHDSEALLVALRKSGLAICNDSPAGSLLG